MRAVLFLIACFSCFLMSCTTTLDEPSNDVQPIERKDISAPKLLQLSPHDQQRISETARTTIDIIGLFEDENMIIATLNGQRLNLVSQGKGIYRFETSVNLLPGENNFLLQAKDTIGNSTQKEITYFNGQAPRLVLQSERNELPPGSTTFFEIFLDQNGQMSPLPIEEVKLYAQRGTFQGAKYKAPSESGSDLIFAEYKSKNAKGRTRVSIRKTSIDVQCIGPNTAKLGNEHSLAIQIKNNGELESLQNKVNVKLPSMYEFVSADKDGEYFAPIHEIHWTLEALGPGIQENLNFVVHAEKIGKEVLIVTLRSGNETIQNTSFIAETMGAIHIQQKSDFSVVSVDKEFIVTFQITAKENLKKLKTSYQFDHDRTIFQGGTGTIKGQSLKFVVENNSIRIYPENVVLLRNESLSGEMRFRVRRAGILNNRIECVYWMSNGNEQTIADPLTITSE